MKVLWLGDAGAHTGFARVCHAIGERLISEYGHDVSVLAANYRGDYFPTTLKLYRPDLLARQDIFGMSRIVKMLGDVMPDAIVMLNDPAIVMRWLFDNAYDTEGVLFRGIEVGRARYKPPIIAYMPIDGYDNPKAWNLITQRCQRVALSHFGQAAMPEAPVIWHGVDTSVYKPVDKREAKKAIGFDPDSFLILRTDKNDLRKDYPDLWRSLRPVLRAHDNIEVVFHCQSRTNTGYDLRAYTSNDEDINQRLHISTNFDGYIGVDDEALALMYSAADLYVSTSWGEGFGLTLLEAMACGTPVIATDCSSITEVVGPGGMLIQPKGRIPTPMGQDQCLPDTDAFTEAIERMYRNDAMRRRYGYAATKHASQFSWDVAARKMNDLLVAAVGGTL